MTEGLRGFYGLYVMHGLLMPDTPAQAALRQRIDEWGMFPFLDHLIAFSPSPGQFAESLVVCLAPPFDNLYEALMEQLAVAPYVFRIPGDDTGVAGFGETWIRTLREQTAAGRESGGGVHQDAHRERARHCFSDHVRSHMMSAARVTVPR
ncbi:hypothetical protein ACIRPJ_33255 [Streptomyces asoensis]|uniref:hypothetical protein n=1 Tax=Streptomyces asoensis TaxID=249586 RepID=UPI00167ADA88|nr:hypothetical protein [Streptomyces asoensis]GGQ97439.1 hypothetical protein GCM10010496_72960 [Streptomyces asoensis]